MPIRPPASAEIGGLIAALDADDAVARETAVARLAVAGARAIEPLLRACGAAAPRQRAGILRALETSGDARALPLGRDALRGTDHDAYAPAAGVLRALLASGDAPTSAAALDELVAAALDATRPGPARLAALDVLREAPGGVLAGLSQTLARDPDPDVRAWVGAAPGARRGDEPAVWSAAVSGRLPASPDALKTAVAERRGMARLTELQHLVDHVRSRERLEPDPAAREQWRVVRGAIHQALAARNSRLALYDLRDSLLEPERLPVAFLAALEEIGDASCLEALAAAYDASSRSGDTWWREHVAKAFRAIVQRDGLTRRHAAVKRTMARWPDAARDLMARL